MNKNFYDRAEILEGVLSEFKNLAAIPRQSKHEQAVSNFLKNYLADLNFEVAQDEQKNIIAEIPASHDKKNSPTTILQAHMDMVCVAEEGYNYNPLTDPIKLIRTENFLEAEGTSLGADDGIGVAEILYIAKNAENFSHGPIKIIFTTDEEQGMSGAIGIDEKIFLGAEFLINCDSENFDELVVGSAGSVHIDFTKKISHVALDENFQNYFRVKISGLCGGHSGTEISANRANALKVMKNFLRRIEPDSALAKIFGGEAPNVIPSSAEAVIASKLDPKKISEHAKNFSAEFKKIFGDSEKNFSLEIIPVDKPEKIFSQKDFSEFLDLVSLIHSGIYSMSREISELVETSANLGLVRTEENFLQVSLLPRSNVSEILPEFIEMNKIVAKLTNFDIQYTEPSPAWNYNPKSRLEKIMSEIFQQQNNFPAKVHTIHAGLECSFFLKKNPALDIVSIGTTNENIHSPKERLHLKTIPPQVSLIVETLKKISELERSD